MYTLLRYRMKRLLLLAIPLLVLLAPVQTQGQASSRAGVVVKFSDGSVQTRCVAFPGESISGLQLLQQSGIDVIAQPSGGNAAVCKIGPDGCDFPAEPCFCKFGGGQEGQYWAYWRLAGGAWQYSAQGAGVRRVRNGDVDGWAWGTGSVQTGAQPPVVTFDAICPAAQPTAELKPTARPTVKPTVRPTARPTVRPTARPTPKPTPRPTTQPTARRRPTAAIVASAPTSTPLPSATAMLPTATPVPSTATPIPPTATSLPPTATMLPTATPTVEPTSEPTIQPQATPTASAAGPAAESRPRTNAANYAVFGAMLLGLLGAIAVVQRRRRQ